MKKYAIIVAGGSGTRMKGSLPKQFLLLRGKPVIVFSMEAFYNYDPSIEINIVIHPDYIAYFEELSKNIGLSFPFVVAAGGEMRFHSVKNGLQLIEGDGLVAIHDAARPLISVDFVAKQFAEAEKHGSAMPGIALKDTIRQIEGDASQQLDRTKLRAMQTPQVFRVSELKKAYEQDYRPVFTDDASVMEAAGFPLYLTEGSPRNIKITLPEDIALAEALMDY